MAQLVARLVRIEEVGGSNPPGSTIGSPAARRGFLRGGSECRSADRPGRSYDVPMSTQPTPLHIERAAPKSYVGRNARGAEVMIGSGDADGVFSPGELLAVALAACALLSADHTIASRLGDDFAASVDIEQTKPDGEDRYDRIASTIRANLGALDETQVAALAERAQRAIDRLCTVGHTLDEGAEHPVVLQHDEALPQSV
jgi:uncharacterized OsmC-like protein